ncbi:MAG: DUF3604 domain-containing protein [Polyangiales bacterium]
MQLRVVGGAALAVFGAVGACTLEAEPLGPYADAGDGGEPVLTGGIDAAVPVERCKQYSIERKAFFGDLHVHTALSLDAHVQGTRLRPDLAYGFARGQEVGLPPFTEAGAATRTLKLTRPLDFAAVTDQAEFLGLLAACQTAGFPGYDSAQCLLYRTTPGVAYSTLFAPLLSFAQGNAVAPEPCVASNMGCGLAIGAAWKELRQAAAEAQDDSDACAFSAFVGYEWSALPAGKSLRRSVLFATEQVPARPFSYFDGNQEEDLWSALERDCLQTAGCDALTIPTSANLSAGAMFEPLDGKGAPIDRAYAERRARFEPLMEVFQSEGSSECLPQQGDDALCAFERLPYATLAREQTAEPEPRAFARGALAEGLVQAKQLTANPFPLGFVAGTGTYLGVAGAVEERSYPGSGASGLVVGALLPSLLARPRLNPGGLTAIWAEQNTRASLFAALKRREVYATSGPRITLRVFGGAGVAVDLCSAADFVPRGYATGVPMGGVVPGGGGTLRIAARAERDPGTDAAPGGLLQRMQVVKGALGGKGVQWKLFDLAGAANDASVDPATCAPKGAGAEALCGVWTDPDFDPAAPAVYYVRALENPSCRWQTRACLAARVDCTLPEAQRPAAYAVCCKEEPPKLQQERAWSSPIFYQP